MSPVLLWFLVGIAFFVVELAQPGFIIFFFGLGSWCTALVVYFFDLSLSGQLMVFLATALGMLFLLRSWLRGVFTGSSLQEDDSINVEPLATTGVVIEDILPPAHGRVKYGGSFWQAEAAEPISAGTTVRIVEQKNLLVSVRPAEKEEN
ncbi:MAG: NfeD family protein [Flavobacteriia bacterium]|nr:MAG: NfeD family protein [Flavobacteriia bacterium]